MCGQFKEVAREHLSWKCFSVCQTEKKLFLSLKIVSTNWKTQSYLFFYSKRVFSKSHGCPNTNRIMTTQWPLLQKHDICPINLLNDMNAKDKLKIINPFKYTI